MNDVTLRDDELVSAIIVHYRRHDSIADIVAGLIQNGVRADRLVIVDNSEMPEREQGLRDSLPTGVHLQVVSNRGYGAAVNDGIARLDELGVSSRFLLVATHEVVVDAACIPNLVHTMREDSTLAAVGPVLRNARRPDEVWSTGGYLTNITRVPSHKRMPAAHDHDPGSRVYCEWLDGAIVLYRSSALPARPFDESFFLYMEEVDLHLRIGYAGGTVAIATNAIASQHSDGTPMFLFARNLRLLHKRHTQAPRRWLAILYPIARRGLGSALRGRWRDVRALIKGATVRLPQPDRRVIVVNPLQSALHHYGREMKALLKQAGVPADFISFAEPSAREDGRFAWMRDYISALAKARRLRRDSSSRSIIVLWPVLGFFDLLILRALVGRATLVVHDPVPLVRAVGYGRVGPIAARWVRGRVRMLVHSAAARGALATSTATESDEIRLLPHPMLPPNTDPRRPTSPQVIVMGQYKPDRDVDLLAAIARDADPSWNLRIVGRGWPQVPGWAVDSRFVPEAEFEQILRDASVVLIPYRRFYQSGVAVRALELGTPIVGPRDSVLRDVLGDDSPWLTDDDVSWTRAIRSAVSADSTSIATLQRDAYRSVEELWEKMLVEVFDER